jgi:hypothetical protein
MAGKKTSKKSKVALLSGGNPQIAKADGDAPVQAYIAAMPGWKRDVGRRLDALIVRNVPGVRKAVKWNTSRWLSSEARRCVLSRRASPSTRKCATSTSAKTRTLDEAQMATWIRQAAALPGWVP